MTILAAAAALLASTTAEVVIPHDGSARVCPAAIARAFAPILWFSPDEPLVSATPLRPIPGPVPGDAASSPVVYYQVGTTVERPAPLSVDCPDERVEMVPGNRVSVRYFFYYWQDIGTNPHRHDLEGAVLDLRVGETTASTARLRLEHVRALAHGLGWLDNRLDVAKLRRSPFLDPHVELPLTLLVEEGKHASVPDRNADGVYTPGYDVNVYVREAWGVRDTFGSGILMPRFSAELAKPRAKGRRVFPPSLLPEHECATVDESHYELRPATRARGPLLSSAEASGSSPDAKKLRGMVSANHFGEPAKNDGVLHWMGENLSLVVRRDVGWRMALLSKLAHLPVVDGWLIGRLSKKGLDFGREWGFELVYSPTASGWISPYVSGAGYGIPRSGDTWAWRNFEWRPELGLKFRFGRDELPKPLPGFFRFLFPIHNLGRFIGLRAGLRAEPLDDALMPSDAGVQVRLRGTRTIRFVWEMGGGAW